MTTQDSLCPRKQPAWQRQTRETSKILRVDGPVVQAGDPRYHQMHGRPAEINHLQQMIGFGQIGLIAAYPSVNHTLSQQLKRPDHSDVIPTTTCPTFWGDQPRLTKPRNWPRACTSCWTTACDATGAHRVPSAARSDHPAIAIPRHPDHRQVKTTQRFTITTGNGALGAMQARRRGLAGTQPKLQIEHCQIVDPDHLSRSFPPVVQFLS